MAAARDLRAADVIYYQLCRVNFHTGKQQHAKISTTGCNTEVVKVSRLKDDATEEAFTSIVEMLMNDELQQWTISDLCTEMGKTCDSPYSNVYMKKRLIEVLGDSVTICNVDGKPNVVTFNITAATILNYLKSQEEYMMWSQKSKYS